MNYFMSFPSLKMYAVNDAYFIIFESISHSLLAKFGFSPSKAFFGGGWIGFFKSNL